MGHNKVVMVTGAAQGIGRATAEKFLAHGWQVLAIDQQAEGLASLQSAMPTRVATLVLDVTGQDAPAEAMALLCAAVEKNPHAALIGSSLGGYYATYLAERYALRAVLVNPAVKPHALLRNHLGPQKNLYTGASYELTAQHVTELEALDTATIAPARYLLLTRTGDEVLDYRDAVEKYSGAMQRVIPGGDHGFGDFADYLDEALAFCGMSPRFP